MTAYNTDSDSIKISDLRSKVKATVTQYPFLYFHEIVEGLYFHCTLSVCVSVCVSVCLSVCLSVCPEILVNKILAERMHRFGSGFGKSLRYALCRFVVEFHKNQMVITS